MKESKIEQLKFMAFEGQEENKIIHQLIKEIKIEHPSTEDWSAKTKILAELIEKHFIKEVQEIFPTLKKTINVHDDMMLAQNYKTTRSLKDEIPTFIQVSAKPTTISKHH